MKTFIFPLSAALAAILFALVSVTFAEEITFKFNPPDSISFIQNLKSTRSTEMGAMGKRDEVTESSVQIVMSKTADGYNLIATPISVSTTMNGQPVDNPILALLQNAVVTYNIDKDGQIISITGYEKLIDIMKSSFPEQVWESISSYLNPEALANKDAAEWNGRIGSFIGRSAKIGEAWPAVTDSFTIPNGGTIRFYSTTKVTEKTKCGNGDCVRVRFSYNTDPRALFEFMGNAANDLAKVVGDSTFSLDVSGGTITGSGERLVDPQTMLIYSETIERSISTKMTMPGQGEMPITQSEKREYLFDYGK